MNEIYNKINNHEYLDKNDISKIIYICSKGKFKTKFSKEYNEYAICDFDNYKVVVDPDIINMTLEYLKNWCEECIELNDSKNPNFLVDLYNIYLLWILTHELVHIKQVENMDKKPNIRTKIIKENYNFFIIDEGLYSKNHDFYYHEFNATIVALIKVLNVVQNKCTNLNNNSIIIYNRIIADLLYSSYGIEKTINDETYYDNISPISYTKYLSKRYYNLLKQMKLYFYIKRLEKYSDTEYKRFVNGLDIKEDIIKLLYDVSYGNYYTDNILEEIKNISKTKVK